MIGLATAFTEQEIEYLRKRAIEVAGKIVSVYGMRKVSLDQIMSEVGASKLIFYKLFESKEHLFLAFLKDFHERMVQGALDGFYEHSELPMRERLFRCMMYVSKQIDGYQIRRFMMEDFPVLLRKIPEARIFCYEDHGAYVEKVIKATGIKLRAPLEVAAVMIHTVIISVVHRKETSDNDELFWQAYELLVRGTIDQLLDEG